LEFSYFDDDKDVGVFARNSVANMGYSETRCERFKIMDNYTDALHCRTGTITRIVDWGF